MLKIRRNLVGGLIVLSALVLTNPSSAQTNTGPTGRSVVVGDTLLGIRLEKDYMKDVLRRFGQPSEMLAGSPRLTPSMMPSTDQQNGGAGMPGSSPYGGRGNPANPYGGGGGNPANPYGGRGLPNFNGRGGFGGGSGQQEDTKYVEKNEVTWWYHIDRGKTKPKLHYSFLFDKDGRVVQIQEYGFSEGGRTKEGVGLGDHLGDVVRLYGWSNDGERLDNDKLTLRYGVSNKLAFQMVKNDVLGITLAKVK